MLGGVILVSSRLGPRMESAVNMNSQAHDNMSALPRQNDGDDGCSKCNGSAPFFYFYNTLIINSVCLYLSVSVLLL